MREKKLPPPTPSEAAFERLLASFDAESPAQPESHVTLSLSKGDQETIEPKAFLTDLFARKREFLERDPYGTIGEASAFNTKLAGVSFEGRQDMIAGLRPGHALDLRREPDNEFDPNAIGAWYGSFKLGFIKKEIARRLAPNIDAGERYTAEVTALTGGGAKAFGINIYVTRERRTTPAAPIDRTASDAAGVLHALIGDRELRDAQRAVLDRIDAGRNTLAVLGTGRGKSLCFQYPAAVRALERGEKTVVLYPLRALANDQYDALQRRLGPLGLRIHRANGAIDAAERAALNDALETGNWDIICATPEFVQYHLDRFRTPASRPALVVVDEAHHIVESTHRGAYQRIGNHVEALGSPQVLALTATAGDEVFPKIRASLGIEAWVIDPTVRENLHVVDARGTTNKVAYLEHVLRDGTKAIVYCNSRIEATKTAEKLRARLGDDIAFYHAGVGTAERAQVERWFREGAIRIVVATSAFGEGIDLPDVRHVVLYHLNFNFTEFNQQAGRAGRDGDDASIHLLFGEYDRRINDFIIERGAPTLETLRHLYAAMKRIARDGMLRMTFADVASTVQFDKVDGSTVSAAVRIFADAALVETGEDDDGRYVRFLAVNGKVDLTKTERFAEGEAEREAFASFCDVALKAPPEILEALIDRPIYPTGVTLASP